MEWTGSLDQCMDRIRRARRDRETLSLGYHGNIVDLWCVGGRVAYMHMYCVRYGLHDSHMVVM